MSILPLFGQGSKTQGLVSLCRSWAFTHTRDQSHFICVLTNKNYAAARRRRRIVVGKIKPAATASAIGIAMRSLVVVDTA